MSRPLRIEFEDAVYHVTSRGDRREPIFLDDDDRRRFLALLGQACDRFDAAVLAYCLMGNHYHLVLRTRQANLSTLMRHLNGVYTQRFNRRHGRVGHVFQGRFKAILVDAGAYLLALCRYVELNPVRAGLAATAADWPWSSYRAHVGTADGPPWLDTPSVAAALLGRAPVGVAGWQDASQRYAAHVADGLGQPLWPQGLRQQVYLGDVDFVARMQARAAADRLDANAVPRPQRAAPQPLAHWLAVCPTREQALLQGRRHSGLTLTAMARELGLSTARVSPLVARAERQERTSNPDPAGADADTGPR
jgi:REP element-mobilizing transposase RayT